MDAAATVGLIGEDTLQLWMNAYEEYGITDGIKIVSKKTRLKFANSKTKISNQKAYLMVVVFGKSGRIEVCVVKGDMCMLFSRKCVEELDIAPRLKRGRVYCGEEQEETVMSQMLNGHTILPIFPTAMIDEHWTMSVEEALEKPIKNKKGELLVYEVFCW